MVCHESVQSDVHTFLPISSSKTKPGKTPSQRKRVRFPDNPVQSVVVFDDTVARNFPCVIWYSSTEIQFIKERNLESIRRCRLYGPLDETDCETFLGLDVLVERKKARWKRQQIYQAVMSEQSRQLIMHRQKSPELLAEAYRQKMDQVNALVPIKRIFAQSA